MSDVARKAVLLTRPSHQNQPLAGQLRMMNRRVIEFPALSISAAPDTFELDRALQNLEQYALVVFVSPNAIDQTLLRLHRPWPASVPIAVMGPGSRARLEARGIGAPEVRVTSPGEGSEVPEVPEGPEGPKGLEAATRRFDSEALFASLDAESLVGRSVLIVRGNGGRDWLRHALEDKHVRVEAVTAYHRSIGEPVASALEEVRGLIDREEPSLIVITSSEAIACLVELFGSHFGDPGVTYLKCQQILVSHGRIAENATAAGFALIHQAEAGDEALMRAIEYLPD